MTHDYTMNEEKFLIDKVLSARHAVEQNAAAQQELRAEKARLEKYRDECEEAMIDYMRANGLMQFQTDRHYCDIGKSFSVDVPDIAAVPDQYVRVKTVREPNKALISAAKPKGNWYTLAESNKITIRSK